MGEYIKIEKKYKGGLNMLLEGKKDNYNGS